MKVLVVAEYYPRAGDPVRGIWAHRQALACAAAGAEIRVLVLHRPVPPLQALRRGDLRAAARELAQPPSTELDGIEIRYVRYISPPRPLSYGSWGAYAAPFLRRAIAECRAGFPFELIHAHYAVPAGDAVRRAAAGAPLVVSVHGGDVFGPAATVTRGSGARTVPAALAHARLVIANSAETARRCEAHGARRTRVVHLGTDVPPQARDAPSDPLAIATVAHLVQRKRHADVIEALALLRGRGLEVRWTVIGDGPHRGALEALARARGVHDAIDFRGALDHPSAVAAARRAALFVLPSVDEAFGVAYVEAMAGGVPCIGCAGEAGPQEIAALGGGIELVPPRNPAALAARIETLLSDPERRRALGEAARDTVTRWFTWERCGKETLDVYELAISER